MKKLVMSALLIAAVSQAAGCIFVSDDTQSGTASVTATWTVLNAGASAACPAGATTAAVNAQRSSDATPFVDLYNCADGVGDAADLPAGDYQIWVDLTDDSGGTLYAQSESANISLTDGEHAQADFQIDGYNGFWDVSWQINQANGTPTSCAAVTNDGVSVLSTLAGATDGLDSVWNCTDGEAPTVRTTDPLPVGDYVVVVSLLNAAQQAIGDAPDINATIDHGNQYVDLGLVTITLF